PDYRADGEITGAALHCLNVLYRVQLSRDKAVELYGHLKLLADSYKKNEHYSRDNLFTIMTNILARKQEKTSGGYSSGGSKTETNEWGIPIHEGYHSRQEPMILDELDEPVSLRDDLCGYLGQMNANSRHLFLREVVRNGSASPVQRDVLVRSLADRSGWSSSQAWQHLKKLPLTDDEVKTLEGFLRFKDGAMRQHVYLKLLDQNPKKLGESIQRLRSDKDKMRAAAGEELLSILGRRKTEAKYQDVWLACAGPEAEEEGGEKAAEKKTSAAPALDPFFDLYDSAAPLTEFSLDAPDLSPEKLFPITFEQVKKFLDAFDAAIIQNAEYQYKAQGGYTVVLGAEGWLRSVYRPDGDYDRESRRALGLDNYPLPEVWRDLARKLGVTAKFIVLFNKLELARKSRNDYDQKPDWLFSLPWFSGFAQVAADVREYYGKKSIKHPRKIETLAGTLQTEIPPAERYAVLRPIVRAFLTEEAGNPKKYYSYVDPWFGSLRVAAVSDEDFTDCFKLTYGCVCRSLEKNNSLSFDARDFARVHALGLLSEEELTRLLVSYGKVAPPLFYTLTEPKRSEKIEIFKTYPRFTPVRDRIVQRVVETEIRRGEMATSVSGIAGHIERFEGARHFVDILERMGKNKNPFDRSGYGTNTKRAMLSHLIQACRPTSGEDAAALGKLLEGKNIPTQTLLDGAMFAPQWIGLVAEHLGWKGLESACWYFHAHVNENFSAEKETIVARFSDIAPQDFNDGAFDVEWFREAHAALGKERFAMVYSAAKYISGGASHRRAQLFADAVTGKLKLSETEAEVVKKRSKNHVLCYGLIPFKKGGKKDAGASTKDILHRYEVLQKFLKESKQFGAQRRASEALVVRVSTENLARGAGYGNVTRFVWSMEGEKLDSVKPYFEKKNVEDVTLRLQADADGKVELKVEAKGKELKDVPSRVKKDPYVEELREVQKSLRDQYSRARLTMEQAMEREEKFEAGELAKLAVHPVIGPIVNKLVFRSKDGLGYIQDFKRQTDELIVAHPVHLMESGRWSEFQRELFDKEIRQPFKQVFRELYVPTEDELSEGSVSRRYAGHQVQPKRGVALLRTRGWTVHYEEGLQKVYHKENLVAEIYAAADWFSPADVEPPTLEYVTFHSRKDYKTVPIADVPKIIFSEVMRDVDLMVSVAHAGGVDPEASASTVETRRAIAAEVVRLFKLDNVRFEGTHAFIKGVRGEYTVHLGSALAHKMAAGALYVLAVPSQHRGRIFLPFVDEDPRTAEVMSKILLFAEDGKIKDPAILSQMRGEEP
ncbi:MAG: DUF4132 domain-containing protein, partial [Synergistaceae bacterium]|nr:DUF4132 domain-containing protein [Synergistaceae bacterium]